MWLRQRLDDGKCLPVSTVTFFSFFSRLFRWRIRAGCACIRIDYKIGWRLVLLQSSNGNRRSRSYCLLDLAWFTFYNEKYFLLLEYYVRWIVG